MREQAHRVRNASERNLDRDGDLFFHLFRSAAREERNHVDLGIRNVWERLHRQVLERDNARTDKKGQRQPDGELLLERKLDKLGHRCATAKAWSRKTPPPTTTRSPFLRPSSTSQVWGPAPRTLTTRRSYLPGPTCTKAKL